MLQNNFLRNPTGRAFVYILYFFLFFILKGYERKETRGFRNLILWTAPYPLNILNYLSRFKVQFNGFRNRISYNIYTRVLVCAFSNNKVSILYDSRDVQIIGSSINLFIFNNGGRNYFTVLFFIFFLPRTISGSVMKIIITIPTRTPGRIIIMIILYCLFPNSRVLSGHWRRPMIF